MLGQVSITASQKLKDCQLTTLQQIWKYKDSKSKMVLKGMIFFILWFDIKENKTMKARSSNYIES